MLLCTSAAPVESDGSYIDVEQDRVQFNDQSALNQADNLKSKTYQDFIHTLYRFDKGNLAKVDGLFTAAGGQQAPVPSANPKWDDFETPQLLISPDFVAPEIPEISSNRQRRALFFRPLFVYRDRQQDQNEQAARSKRYRHSEDRAYFLNDDDNHN